MSEEQLKNIIHETKLSFKQVQQEITNKIVVYVVGGLILTMLLGGFTMIKIFNVSQKADKIYVDNVYKSVCDMMRIMENRTLVLEQMVAAEKTGNQDALNSLQTKLNELNIMWADHMKWHLEKTRAAGQTENLFYYGEPLPEFCNILLK